MSILTLDDVRAAAASLQMLSIPKISFNPMLERRIDTNHPRRLLKKWRFEPRWLFDFRQKRSNKKHGLYYIMEPQIYMIDHDQVNDGFGLGFGFSMNRGTEFIAHPIFKDQIEKGMRALSTT